MSAIIFDEELRQFSVVDDEGYVISDETFSAKKNKPIMTGLTGAGKFVGKAGAHIMNNKRAYMDVGGTAVGALGARAIAKKMALKRGLEPGTPEYKAFVNKMTAGGAAAGLALSEAGQYGYNVGKAYRAAAINPKTGKYNKSLAKKRSLTSVMKSTANDMYVDPAKRGYETAKQGVIDAGRVLKNPMANLRGAKVAAKYHYNKDLK